MKQGGNKAKKDHVYATEYETSVVMEPVCGFPSSFAGNYKALILSNAADLLRIKISGSFIDKLQKYVDLTSDELAEIIGVSRSKYYRLQKEVALELSSVDILSAFLKLWNKGIIAFDGNDSNFREWLHTPNFSIGGITPIKLLSTETGRREVEKILDRIEYSVYG